MAKVAGNLGLRRMARSSFWMSVLSISVLLTF
jgi:hypothetical protein